MVFPLAEIAEMMWRTNFFSPPDTGTQGLRYVPIIFWKPLPLTMNCQRCVPGAPVRPVSDGKKESDTGTIPPVVSISHRYPVLGFSGRTRTILSPGDAERIFPLSSSLQENPAPAIIPEKSRVIKTRSMMWYIAHFMYGSRSPLWTREYMRHAPDSLS